MQVEPVLRKREDLVRRLIVDIGNRAEPVIVAGDLNATDQSDIHRTLTATLTDAHEAAGWGLGHTFPAYGGSWRGIPILPRQMRLDMILYSDDFVALEFATGSHHGESDHLPVAAALGWRE